MAGERKTEEQKKEGKKTRWQEGENARKRAWEIEETGDGRIRGGRLILRAGNGMECKGGYVLSCKLECILFVT